MKGLYGMLGLEYKDEDSEEEGGGGGGEPRPQDVIHITDDDEEDRQEISVCNGDDDDDLVVIDLGGKRQILLWKVLEIIIFLNYGIVIKNLIPFWAHDFGYSFAATKESLEPMVSMLT